MEASPHESIDLRSLEHIYGAIEEIGLLVVLGEEGLGDEVCSPGEMRVAAFAFIESARWRVNVFDRLFGRIQKFHENTAHVDVRPRPGKGLRKSGVVDALYRLQQRFQLERPMFIHL